MTLPQNLCLKTCLLHTLYPLSSSTWTEGGPNIFLQKIAVAVSIYYLTSSIFIHEGMNDWHFTVSNSNKNHNLLIIYFVRFDNPIGTSRRPSTIILPVGGLIQANKCFMGLDDFQHKCFGIWLVQEPPAAFESLFLMGFRYWMHSLIKKEPHAKPFLKDSPICSCRNF